MDLAPHPGADRYFATLSLGRTPIHQLAHINGAPAHGAQAEEAVLAAGMGRHSEKGNAGDKWTLYDPSTQG